jgi:hypothetical protein
MISIYVRRGQRYLDIHSIPRARRDRIYRGLKVGFGGLSSSNSSVTGLQSRSALLSHLAGGRGWVCDVFMLLSVMYYFMMTIWCWGPAPKPPQSWQADKQPQSRQAREGRRASNISHGQKVAYVISYGSRRHPASHPNPIAS